MSPRRGKIEVATFGAQRVKDEPGEPGSIQTVRGSVSTRVHFDFSSGNPSKSGAALRNVSLASVILTTGNSIGGLVMIRGSLYHPDTQGGIYIRIGT